eukprot:TRINITY_DN69087_c0_g1_i1.p1 TRINITY_DN69087_c0_g1~~TRINITY_DN69087_c0_g1_i1.p1  ORF type:complete len:210 (+),score=42.81 TRINITY_DN69087_c0_g1_i1:57-632(+)
MASVRLTFTCLGLLCLVGASNTNGLPDYSKEANDVIGIMESVRSKPATPPKSDKSDVKTTVDAALSDELMSRADQIEHELFTKPTLPPHKTAALASRDRGTSQNRAARFFATHGMKGIGQILGDHLSAEEEHEALAETEAAQKALSAPVMQTQAISVTSRSDPSSLSVDDDDDLKQRWKAVDELRRRATHV